MLGEILFKKKKQNACIQIRMNSNIKIMIIIIITITQFVVFGTEILGKKNNKIITPIY